MVAIAEVMKGEEGEQSFEVACCLAAIRMDFSRFLSLIAREGTSRRGQQESGDV